MRYVATRLLVAALLNEKSTALAQRWLGGQPAGELAISDWVVNEFSAGLSMKLRTGGLEPPQRKDMSGILCVRRDSGSDSCEPVAVHDGELVHGLFPFLGGAYLVGEPVDQTAQRSGHRLAATADVSPQASSGPPPCEPRPGLPMGQGRPCWRRDEPLQSSP